MRTAVTAATMGVGLLVMSSPAQAGIYDGDRGTWTTDETFELCGFTLHHVEHGEYNWRQFAMTGPSEGLFKNHVVNDYTATYTNVANGRFLVEEGHNQGHNIGTAPIVYGNVHEGTVLEEAWVTLSDMAGHVLVRENGSYTTVGYFDDGGDDVPGGTPVGESTVTRFSGRHPFAEMTDEQLCALITPGLEG